MSIKEPKPPQLCGICGKPNPDGICHVHMVARIEQLSIEVDRLRAALEEIAVPPGDCPSYGFEHVAKAKAVAARRALHPATPGAPTCPDHWHCDPKRAPHLCDKPDRTKPCPSCSSPSAASSGGE